MARRAAPSALREISSTMVDNTPVVRRNLSYADVLNDLAARVAALEATVTALSKRLDLTFNPAGLFPQSGTDDARFLAAIAASVHGHAFSARELVNHATVDPELRAALDGVTSAKRVGKRLHRLADRNVGGLTLRRVDRDRDGTIWIVQVADLHAND
jgi:NAD(P)-dependent dehydrogenase (short-subunit alcohol dehydrogenase family)